VASSVAGGRDWRWRGVGTARRRTVDPAVGDGLFICGDAVVGTPTSCDGLLWSVNRVDEDLRTWSGSRRPASARLDASTAHRLSGTRYR